MKEKIIEELEDREGFAADKDVDFAHEIQRSQWKDVKGWGVDNRASNVGSY